MIDLGNDISLSFCESSVDNGSMCSDPLGRGNICYANHVFIGGGASRAVFASRHARITASDWGGRRSYSRRGSGMAFQDKEEKIRVQLLGKDELNLRRVL